MKQLKWNEIIWFQSFLSVTFELGRCVASGDIKCLSVQEHHESCSTFLSNLYRVSSSWVTLKFYKLKNLEALESTESLNTYNKPSLAAGHNYRYLSICRQEASFISCINSERALHLSFLYPSQPITQVSYIISLKILQRGNIFILVDNLTMMNYISTISKDLFSYWKMLIPELPCFNKSSPIHSTPTTQSSLCM